MTHFFDKIFITSYTVKIIKPSHVLQIEDNKSCFRAVAEKLQHATSDQQTEKYLVLAFETLFKCQGFFLKC